MNFGTMMLPLIFLVFLMIYQASPETYYETIDETFSKIEEGFEEDFPTEYKSKTATLNTMISFFLKAALYSAFGIAVMVVWIATIIPFSGETLFWIYITVLIISSIPWSILIGVGLMINDKIKKRKE